MLSAITIALVLGSAPASAPATPELDDQLWATCVAPDARAPAGTQVVLVERVPLIKAAEGYPPSFAALASVLEWTFPTEVPSVSYAAPAIDAAILNRVSDLVGTPPKPKELERLTASMAQGDLRRTVEPLMRPYREAVTKADQLRRRDGKALLSLGQIRMAFLRVAAATRNEPESLDSALAGFASLHHARVVARETPEASFPEIVKDLQGGRPSLLVCKSGGVYVVVGAIDDGSNRYLILADPHQVTQIVRTGKDNVQPDELESKDPRTRNFVQFKMNLKFYLDYQLSRSSYRPAGVLVRPFDPTQYRRWMSYLRLEPDLKSVSGLEDELTRVARKIKEVSHGQ